MKSSIEQTGRARLEANFQMANESNDRTMISVAYLILAVTTAGAILLVVLQDQT